MLTTSSDDVLNGTALNDLFDGSQVDTLQTGDIILDSTSTDADILNATVTVSDSAARIQNIETLNITGKIVDTGIDLTNVIAAKELNLNTDYKNGTATVTNASTLAVEEINAGANIRTLEVSAATFGTRDTLKIDSNNAEDVTLDGTATALNNIELTTKGDVTINTLGANSEVTVNLSDAETSLDGNNALANLIVNQTAVDSVITLDGVLTTAAAPAGNVKTIINSDQDVTVKSVKANIDGTAMESTGTGSLTVKITDGLSATASDTDLSSVKADVIDLSVKAAAAADSAVIVNASSKVKISADMQNTAATETLKITQSYDATVTDAAKLLSATQVGALQLEVAKSQTLTVATDNTTKTLMLNAGIDAAADEEDTITLAKLDLAKDAAAATGLITSTVLVNGAEDLEISQLSFGGATTGKFFLSAEDMTGDLTISALSEAATAADTDLEATIILGKGDDSLTTGTTGKGVYTVEGTSGTNTINISAAAAGSKVTGGTGDDTITGNADGATLNGGAGDDTITTGVGVNTVDGGTGDDTVILGGTGADTITLGAGADKVVVDSGTNGSNIKDFVTGEDTIILTGAGAAINLSSLATAPTTAGVYDFDGSTNFNTTLKNGGVALSTKDVADSVQLGYTKADGTMVAYTLAADTTVVAGDKDDVISVATKMDGTITSGDGSDTVIIAIGTGAGTASNTTISDFTVGSDKVIVTGVATGTATNLTAISPDAGKYSIDGATTTLTGLTLSNGGTAFTATDLTTMVQLGYKGAAFTAEATAGTTITGGTFDDHLAGGTAGQTDVFNFIDNGGMDTITVFVAGEDDLSFDAMTGITDTTGAVVGTAGVTAADGKVYVMSDNTVIAGDTIDYSKIGTNVDGVEVKVTDANIMADVAAYISNALDREAAGDSYVAVINDVTGAANEAYAYSVEVNASGTITADDITLIGTITATAAILTDADIA